MPAPSFTNPATTLPERFYAPVPPQPVKAPRLLVLNRVLAEEINLDLDWLTSPNGLAMLAGNAFPETAYPVAMAYAGHQFGHFTQQLGDGRALLIGEIIDRNGQRRDIQLKGSGRTPFSRGGDGRSALAPALREFLISEAMHALGIPTTRSLAVVATGDHVVRETVQPGGISTRVAASHIRVGTFQFFAARGDTEALRILCRHVIERHYPALAAHENPPLAMLDAVIARQAALIAKWMSIGFIHGVMNTDNMTASGETIDYGPCAFMDNYDPNTVFSSIDHYSRYAYGNQPKIAHWNLARLAETLLPLLDPDPDKALELATQAINRFPPLFETATTQGLRAKLGLLTEEPGDLALAQDLLEAMAASKADYTLTFRHLCEAESSAEALDSLRQLFATTGGIDSWIIRWRERISREDQSPEERYKTMHLANPAIIPRNHLVEAALSAAIEGDMAPYERLLAALARPYADQPEYADLAQRPAPPDTPYLTFCGT
jgi:serine/tyrosine/threonine adenylyltransferase